MEAIVVYLEACASHDEESRAKLIHASDRGIALEARVRQHQLVAHVLKRVCGRFPSTINMGDAAVAASIDLFLSVGGFKDLLDSSHDQS